VGGGWSYFWAVFGGGLLILAVLDLQLLLLLLLLGSVG